METTLLLTSSDLTAGKSAGTWSGLPNPLITL